MVDQSSPYHLLLLFLQHNRNLEQNNRALTPPPLEQEPQLKQVCDRLHKLPEYGLDPFYVLLLALYDQPVAFTPMIAFVSYHN